ncbi:copper chaperone PCu(A)C (plasmid) [Paracoccus liaowanqingii]|uniref:Copper chaperone PCu(A)C n=1 Tax=Paracoccus liaowanqingii TaxID=2560053 RepID=A0A4Y5SUB3_9RHOB|nr:copper chaperone PCu(A)C [Paracoccus liaowanqingii]QDA36385.1 copper chaperone PCu(A)C [Paracoccus liaowanqingii]
MYRIAFAAALILAALPAAAQDGHDHLAEAQGLRILHAWTPATAGPEALIYMEIENGSDQALTLSGAQTEDGQTARLVGFAYAGGVETWQPLPDMPIAAGQYLDLVPRGLALQLSDLPAPLTQGQALQIEVMFGEIHLDVAVEVEAAGASAHSHAGHSH